MQPDPSAENILKPFLQNDDIRVPMARLKAVLPSAAEIWIVGGALRNAIMENLHGRSPLTEDIDVFITGVDAAFPLEALALTGEVRKTELGGICWLSHLSPYALDISLLPKFVIIEAFHLDPTPECLLSAIDFDVNAVMWNWDRQAVMTAGCVDAIACKVIDFNATLVFDRVLLAYRILVIRHKTGFSLSGRVFQYVKSALDVEMLKRLKTMMIGKLGKPMALTVMKDYDRVCRCGSCEELSRRLPAV